MNLKLNNDENEPTDRLDSLPYSSAEERRRTGRYVAIVVGISLVCLAIYHAWVRRVPVLASLLVPALIMLLYIAWVLYTASKDKRKALDYEMGLGRVGDAREAEIRTAGRSAEVLQIDHSHSAAVLPNLHKTVPAPNISPKTVPNPNTPPNSTPLKQKSLTPRDPNTPKEFRRCYSIA